MVVDLISPVDERQLAQIDPSAGQVQFGSGLSEGEYHLLGDWMSDHPSLSLRVYGAYDGSITDLDFLRWFPTLRSFAVDVYHLGDIQGLEHLPEDVVWLGLGQTRRRLSLGTLARFGKLRGLSLRGHSKDIEVVSQLTTLDHLVLTSITLPGLDLLQPLERLRSLDISLGGTKELGLLPTIGRLEYLELWQVLGLHDLTPISGLPHLEFLFLQSLRRAEQLPDLSGCAALTRVHLETMKGLHDLSALATARALEHVALVDMSHLAPEAVIPLLDCRELSSVWAGLGSDRKNRRVKEILGDRLRYDGAAWSRAKYWRSS